MPIMAAQMCVTASRQAMRIKHWTAELLQLRWNWLEQQCKHGMLAAGARLQGTS